MATSGCRLVADQPYERSGRSDRRAVGLLVGLGVVLAAATISAGQAASAIAARDQLTILVYNAGAKEDAYSGEFPVDVDSTFEYPTLGRIKAASLTAREVEADAEGQAREVSSSVRR